MSDYVNLYVSVSDIMNSHLVILSNTGIWLAWETAMAWVYGMVGMGNSHMNSHLVILSNTGKGILGLEHGVRVR